MSNYVLTRYDRNGHNDLVLFGDDIIAALRERDALRSRVDIRDATFQVRDNHNPTRPPVDWKDYGETYETPPDDAIALAVIGDATEPRMRRAVRKATMLQAQTILDLTLGMAINLADSLDPGDSYVKELQAEFAAVVWTALLGAEMPTRAEFEAPDDFLGAA